MSEQQNDLFETTQGVTDLITFTFESINEIGMLLNAIDGYVRSTGLQGASEVLQLATRLSETARMHMATGQVTQ